VPATRTVISPPASGPSALLDKISVRKPQLEKDFEAKLSAPTDVASGGQFTYTLAIHNGSEVAVNGVQAVLALPEGVQFLGAVGGSATINSSQVIVTIGRLPTSAASTVQITVQVLDSAPKGDQLKARGHVRSSTALPVDAGSVTTKVN